MPKPFARQTSFPIETEEGQRFGSSWRRPSIGVACCSPVVRTHWGDVRIVSGLVSVVGPAIQRWEVVGSWSNGRLARPPHPVRNSLVGLKSNAIMTRRTSQRSMAGVRLTHRDAFSNAANSPTISVSFGFNRTTSRPGARNWFIVPPDRNGDKAGATGVCLGNRGQ